MANTTWTNSYGDGNWFHANDWNGGVPVDSSTTLQTVIVSGTVGAGPTISPAAYYVSTANVIYVKQPYLAGNAGVYQDYQLDGQSIDLTQAATLTMQGVALGRPGGTGGLAASYSTISGVAAPSATPAVDTKMSITATGLDTAMFNDVNHNFGVLGASGAGNTLNVVISVGGNVQNAHALFNYGEIDATAGGEVGINLSAPTTAGDTVGFYNEGWVLANGGTFIASSVADKPVKANAGATPDGFIEISNAGEAVLGTVAAKEEVLFNGGVNNTLALSSPGKFAGSVAGFGAGQTIDVQGFSGAANVGTTVVNGVTELVTTNGTAKDIITLAGSIAPFFDASTITQNGTITEVLTADAKTYTFTGGGTTTSWFNPGNWTGGVSPGATIHAGETVTVPTGTASIGGTAVTDNGTIDVTGSTTSLTDTTSMAGNGTIFIDNGAQVTLSNSAGNDSSLTVDFGTHGTTLAPNVFDVNGNTLGFGGTINGFGTNDQIVLGSSTEPTPTSANDISLNYNSTTHELTVSSTVAGSVSTETLHLTGTFDTNPGNTLADTIGSGGITITMPGQTNDFTFSGGGTTTSWFNPGNWTGGVSPGTLINTGETVTVPTGTASIGGTAVTDNGTIDVTGSTTSLTDTTSMAGNGTIFIDNGAHVTLSNSAGNDSSLTVDFGTHGTTLAPNVFDVNGNTLGFGGTINGFGTNDQIVLGSSTEPTPTSANDISLNYNSTTHELTVSSTVAGSVSTETLHLTGTFDTNPGNTLADTIGSGGITITMPGQTNDFTFSGGGTTTSWFNPGNWTGGVSPGTLINTGETVTVPTGTASIGGTAVTDNGTIDVTGSTTSLTDTTSMAGNGTIFIDNGAHVTLSNSAGNDSSLTVDFGTHGTTLAPNVFDVNGNTLGFGGTIAGFGPNDQIVLGNATEPTPPSTADVSLSFNSATGELTVSDTVGGSISTETLHLTGTFDTTPQNTLYDTVGPNGITIQVPCFVEGTRILTSRGEVAVEALAVGDQVITARNGTTARRPIRWIGHRSIALDRHADRSLVEPVRIRAGAFGDNKPARELSVSPDHAIYVDGVLIEAKYLVNGVSVRRDTKARQVTYFHIELDSHDVLIAEGLTAESYISDGNRSMFANGGALVALHPNFAAPAEAERCAPLVHRGAVLDAVRATLRDRVIANGFTTTNAPEAALMVDGVAIAPMTSEAGLLRFALPDDAMTATLHVATATPADTEVRADDRRQVGVKLVAAAVLAGVKRQQVDWARFTGLFPTDEGTGQWSRGEVGIDLAGLTGTNRVLELRYSAAITRWVAPVADRRAIG